MREREIIDTYKDVWRGIGMDRATKAKVGTITKVTALATATTLFLLSGCSSVKVRTEIKNRDNGVQYSMQSNKTDTFRYQPIIGTTQDDTKVMIDMGKFAKIWIKNYKNKNKTFVSSHDIVTMIREPGYISGEEIPANRRATDSKTNNGHTFTFRSSDLMTNTSEPTNELTATQIKAFVNNHQYSVETGKLADGRKVKLNEYDKTISDYIKLKRGDSTLRDKEDLKLEQEIENLKELKRVQEEELKAKSNSLKKKDTVIENQKLIIETKDKKIDNQAKNKDEKYLDEISKLKVELEDYQERYDLK